MEKSYKFITRRFNSLSDEELQKCSNLYSNNYGKYSGKDKRFPAGKRIVMGVSMYKKLYTANSNILISMCYKEDQLLGHAIFLHRDIENAGKCSWVLQLVVDSHYRGRHIGSKLLQSAWGFSDYYAWGLATANAITIKTLESVTWRKVSIEDISRNLGVIEKLMEDVPFVDKKRMVLSHKKSQVFSDFYPELEKSNDNKGLNIYTSKLGKIEPGYEWLAFTFVSQEMSYSKEKLDTFLEFSETQLQDAYSRMDMPVQKWTKGTANEVDFILSHVPVNETDSILDFGCGQGRHCIELSKRGYTNIIGVDFSDTNIAKARMTALEQRSAANFVSADVRKIRLGKKSKLILCMYDVIGSFREACDNKRIITSIKHHLDKNGYAVVSVMNMELTDAIAVHKESISTNPYSLLSLPPSNTMASSGDVFKPELYLINTDDGLVYRKEQFADDNEVFAEYVVADKRYTKSEIESLFANDGFAVVESRYVQAGHWDIPLEATDPKAKEILLVLKRL